MPVARHDRLQVAATCALIAALSAGCATVPRPDPRPAGATGVWEGVMRAGADSLPILVTLEPAGSGWRGSVDVPSQYALGYPLTDVRADSAGIAFAFPDVLPAATFSGALEGGRIGGRFAGESRADTLHGTFELWRRPTRTDPYITESARFRNGDLELVGTLLRPRAPGPHPAVVLVHGSGPQTRDSRRCRARRPCGPACARTGTTIQLPSWKR